MFECLATALIESNSFQIFNFKTAHPKNQVRMLCAMSELRSIKVKGSNNIFKPFSIVNLS